MFLVQIISKTKKRNFKLKEADGKLKFTTRFAGFTCETKYISAIIVFVNREILTLKEE